MQIGFLVAFHFLYLLVLYLKPLTLATSELISTWFPSWIWMGRQIRKGKSWKSEPYYWLNYHGHSLLSSYYPPNILTAWLGSFLKLDNAFRLQVYSVLLHLLLQSVFWITTLNLYFSPEVALFGAITFTYCGWNHRYTQPYIVYTLTWIPLALYPNWATASLGVCMMLLAGYYPYAIFALPVICVINPVCIFGVLLGLPQLIPFFRYMPKTVKWQKATPMKVGFWEHQWYFGIVPLVLLCTLKCTLFVLLFCLLYLRIKQYLPRVPERLFLVLTYLLIFFSLFELKTNIWVLILLQAFDLWRVNSKLCPTRPYTELLNKPSWAFDNKLTRYLKEHLGNNRVSGLPFPLLTGQINEFKTLGYCGGMANRLMAKFRHDNNPNGSGSHDWFQDNEDGKVLDDYRVKFAFTRYKKLDWFPTGIKYLWENPRI